MALRKFFSGLDLSLQKITNMGDGTSATDAVTKQQMDAVVGGAVADSRLPARIQPDTLAATVTDLNNAITNGWYAAGPSAANAPLPGAYYWYGEVTSWSSGAWVLQEFTILLYDTALNPFKYRRMLQNAVWSPWTECMVTTPQADARYAAIAHTHTLGQTTSTQEFLYTTAQVGTTWTKPAGAKFFTVELCAGGGGGGSGRRRAVGTVGSGGAGGGPGALFIKTISPSEMPATLYVTVGDGGAGGAIVTTDSTNGNPGASGGSTVLSTNASTVLSTYLSLAFLYAMGGNGGEGGTAVAGVAATGSGTSPEGPKLGTGGQRRIAVGLTNDGTYGGGGAGGSLTAAEGYVPGGNGYSIDSSAANTPKTTAPIITQGSVGQDASAIPFRGPLGGSGGYPGITTSSGRGGNGKNGGGGGGGASASNGNLVNAGGVGGVGYVRIVAHY